jgi:hypothetical protein
MYQARGLRPAARRPRVSRLDVFSLLPTGVGVCQAVRDP